MAMTGILQVNWTIIGGGGGGGVWYIKVSSMIRVNEYTGLDEQKQKNLRKIVNIFLPIIFSKCFGCSKEPSH